MLKKDKKLLLMGAGNMGKALLQGIIKSGLHGAEDVLVYDKMPERAEEFCLTEGCLALSEATLPQAAKTADTLILAVKPDQIGEAATSLDSFLREDALVISIAAGVSLDKLGGFFEGEKALCRAMPNTPALVGMGATGLCFKNTDARQEEYCTELFESCSLVVKVKEGAMDALTAVSGSGPAYAFVLVEEMAAAGVEMGLSPEDALLLAAATVRGAGELLIKTGEAPGVLTDRVCSPGGTTMAALEKLEAGNFRHLIRKAVRAARDRSKELSK